MEAKLILNYVKKHRVKRGLTQKELANKIGSSEHLISQYETGRRSFDMDRWVDLCLVLGVKAKDIAKLDYETVQKRIDELLK